MKKLKKLLVVSAAVAMMYAMGMTAFAAPASLSEPASLSAPAFLSEPQEMPDGNIFDAEYYAQNNPDVVAALGTDANALYQHYLAFGINEGRKPYDPALAGGSAPVQTNLPIHTPRVNQTSTRYQTSLNKTVSTTEEAYNVITEAIENHVVTITVRNGGSVNFNTLRSMISNYIQDSNICDYDVYNCRGCSLTRSGNTFTVVPTYLTSVAEEMWLDQFTAAYLPNLAGMTDYQKVLAIHDFLCNRIDYDYNTANGNGDQNSAYDGIGEGSGVCGSYASGFQRLAEACGIPSLILTGTIDNGELHAWNIVLLDGQWYHIDCTWGDQDWGISRTYFLIGSDKMNYGNAFGGQVTLAPTSYKAR